MSGDSEKLIFFTLALFIVGISFLFSQATTIPVSKRIVEWKFILPDQNWVKGKVLEGGMTRIEKKGELILGFSPVIRDLKEKRIEVKVFKIDRRADGRETIKELETLEFKSVENIFTNKDYSFRISVENIIDSGEILEKVKPFLSPEGGRCCVTCGDWTACCCVVEMSCGSCCSDSCCQGILSSK